MTRRARRTTVRQLPAVAQCDSIIFWASSNIGVAAYGFVGFRDVIRFRCAVRVRSALQPRHEPQFGFAMPEVSGPGLLRLGLTRVDDDKSADASLHFLGGGGGVGEYDFAFDFAGDLLRSGALDLWAAWTDEQLPRTPRHLDITALRTAQQSATELPWD